MTDETKLRFLIVDDEQNIRRLCVTVGQGLASSVSKPIQPRSALETLETRPPDIVVTDLKLPICPAEIYCARSKKRCPPRKWRS